MERYTVIVTTNDDMVLNYDYDELLYAKLLYFRWRDSNCIKAVQLFDNWTKSTVCPFGM